MTSDVTVSLFTGYNFVAGRGHASNTHGIGSEGCRAPDSNGAGHQHGVVVYKDGSVKITIPGSGENSEVPFQRLILYHSFYKVCPNLAAFRFNIFHRTDI